MAVKEEYVDEEFIDERKITAGYTNRNGRRYLNTINLTIHEEPVSSVLYVSKDEANGDILIYRNADHGGIPRQVQGACARSARTVQHLLNMRGVASQSGLYGFYRIREGYRLKLISFREKPSKDPEYKDISHRLQDHDKSSEVKKQISIGSHNMNRLLDRNDPKKMTFVIEEVYRPKLYIKITCMPSEEAESVNVGVPGSVLDIDTKTDAMIRKVKPNVSITPSRYFRKESGIYNKDPMDMSFDEDNNLIIKIRPVRCEICGRMVDRRYESMYTLKVCSDCKRAVNLLGKETAKHGADFKKIRADVERLKPEVEALKEEVLK